jgi:transcriptional regulator GlxA family with amidase domain
VVLSSAEGAEVTDTLPTYEILSRSGAFNVFSVAPERTVLPLVGGAYDNTLDFLPQLSFADYDAQIGVSPDVIAIPWMASFDPRQDAAVLDWIRGHQGPRTTILAICSGTSILAETGLLDGHRATTNTGLFADMEKRFATTTWLRDVRYVDDGNMVTSTNLAAGIDATLHVVDRLAGRDTALSVAHEIGYSQTAALDDPRFAPPDLPLTSLIATAAYAGRQDQLGVLLYDGMTDLSLAAIVDSNGANLTTRTAVFAPRRTVVVSRDGFLFVPRFTFADVPKLDRVVLPAGDDQTAKVQVEMAWQRYQPQTPAEDIYSEAGQGRTAYDLTFEDIARNHGAGMARASADMLFYPVDTTHLAGSPWQATQALTPATLGVIGAAAAVAAGRIRRPAQTHEMVPNAGLLA